MECLFQTLDALSRPFSFNPVISMALAVKKVSLCISKMYCILSYLISFLSKYKY